MARPFMRIHPNIITIFGFLMSLGYLVTMYEDHYRIALVFLLASALDFIDGTVARATGTETPFGAFLDSTLDRIADIAYVLGITYAMRIPMIYGTLLICVSLLISYTRSRYELASSKSDKLDIGLIERPERILFIGILTIYIAVGRQFLICGHDMGIYIFVVLFVLSVITLLQRIVESWRRLDKQDKRG